MNLNLHKFTLKDLNFIEARRYLHDFAKMIHFGNDFGVFCIALFSLFPIGIFLSHFKMIANNDILSPSLISALFSYIGYHFILCKIAFNHKQKFLYGTNYFQEILDALPNKSQLTHAADIEKQCLFCRVCDTGSSYDLYNYGYRVYSSHPKKKKEKIHVDEENLSDKQRQWVRYMDGVNDIYASKDMDLIRHDFIKLSWIEDNKRQELLEKDKNTKFEMEF